MRLYKTLKYNLIEYILKNKRLIIIPFIALIHCLHIKTQLFNIDSSINGTYLDYFFYYFKGADPISKTEDIVIPIFWLAELFLSTFITIGIVHKDLEGFGIQLLIRENSKVKWWISKCINCLFLCIVYYGIVNITILIFCSINNIELSLQSTDIILESILDSEYFLIQYPLDVTHIQSIITIFFMPFITICALNILQLVLSLFFKPMVSFLVINFYVMLCAYVTNPLCIAEYSILSHNSLYVINGLNTSTGIFLCTIIIIVSIIGGAYFFKKKDIL